MKNKIYLIIFGMFMFFTFSKVWAIESETFINANGLIISNVDYERLSNLGFTANEINQMDITEFEENISLDGKIISSKTLYIKTLEYFDNIIYNINSTSNVLPNRIEQLYLTEKEYYNQLDDSISNNVNNNVSPQFASSVIDSYKSLTIYIIETSSGYRVKNTVIWNKMPTVRTEDKIYFQINNTVKIKASTRRGKQNWKLCSGSDCYTGSQSYGVNSSKWESTSSQQLLHLNPNLKSNEWNGLKLYSVDEIDMYIYADIDKVDSGLNLILLQAYGYYEHNIITDYEYMGPAILEVDVNW